MAGVGYTGQPWWATAPLICQKQGLETPARGTLLRRGLHPQRPHSRSWLLRIAPITVSTAMISQAWDQSLGVDTCCQGGRGRHAALRTSVSRNDSGPAELDILPHTCPTACHQTLATSP